MKQLFIILVCFLSLGATTNKEQLTEEKPLMVEREVVYTIDIEPLSKLADQIAMVETWNKDVFGDNGRAIGHFQIHAISVREYNQTYGTSYTHKDMHDREIGKKVCIGLLKKGIELYQKKFGKDPTTEDLARMWNGGIYSGYKKQSTEKYWDRFQDRVVVEDVTWDGSLDAINITLPKTILS